MRDSAPAKRDTDVGAVFYQEILEFVIRDQGRGRAVYVDCEGSEDGSF